MFYLPYWIFQPEKNILKNLQTNRSSHMARLWTSKASVPSVFQQKQHHPPFNQHPGKKHREIAGLSRIHRGTQLATTLQLPLATSAEFFIFSPITRGSCNLGDLLILRPMPQACLLRQATQTQLLFTLFSAPQTLPALHVHLLGTSSAEGFPTRVWATAHPAPVKTSSSPDPNGSWTSPLLKFFWYSHTHTILPSWFSLLFHAKKA